MTRLDEDAGELAVADDQVVRPLEHHAPESIGRERLGESDAGGQGEAAQGVRSRGEAPRDGQHEALPQARDPAPSMAAPSGSLDLRRAELWSGGPRAQALEGEGLGRVRKIWRSGGYKHGAEDIRFFRRAVLRRRLRAPKSLAFRSALSEARTMPDQQGRLKLATRTQGDRRDRARDDLAAALLIAVAVGERYRERRPRKRAAGGGRVRIEIAG